MTVETVSAFGETDAVLAYLLPVGFDCKANRKRNADFMLKTAIKECWDKTVIHSLEKKMQSVEEYVPFVGSTAFLLLQAVSIQPAMSKAQMDEW